MFANRVYMFSRFSQNCSTFAVECDSERKIYPNAANLGFSLKKGMGFFEKKTSFFKANKGGKFDIECV